MLMRLVVMTGLGLNPSLAHAQVAPTRIAEAVSCASCRITLSTVATLGDTDGPGELTTVPYGVRVDGRGRYWLWGGDAAGGPPVYDTSGRFLRTTGRRGQGPGEFEGVIDAIPLPGDSVLVIDQVRRATLFAPDLSVARHIPLGATLSRSLVVNWPRSVIGFDHYGAGGRGGPVFHEMAFDSVPARVTRSFGPEWSIRDFRTMTASMRITAPTTSGFWAATHDQYRIERWSFEGKMDLVLERSPAWPPRTSEGFGSPDTPPPNSMQAIAEDRAGRLWVFVNVAAPTWREGWPRTTGETRVSAFAQEKMFRTVVEVLDPRAGRAVARRQLDEWIIAALPGERAVIYSVAADGIPRLRIVGFTLEGRLSP